jgi:hypothetical protein
MSLTKADAAQLVKDIRRAKVSGHCIAQRCSSGSAGQAYGFLGGLESILQDFLRKQQCHDAAAAVARAMNDEPTAAEIETRNASTAAMSQARSPA